MTSLDALSSLDQLFLWGLNVAIHVTVLAFILLLVAALLHKAAAVRYWILCFGLVLVLSSPMTSALLQATGSSWLKIAIAPATKAATGSEASPNVANLNMSSSTADYVQGNEPRRTALASSSETQTAHDQGFNESLNQLRNSDITAGQVLQSSELITLAQPQSTLPVLLRFVIGPLLLIWVTGAMLLLIRMTIGWIRLSRILQEAKPILNEHLQLVFDRACSMVGCRREQWPQLVTSNAVFGPIAAGVMRGKVVLPERFMQQVDPESLADVLLHEVAHIVRRDQIVVLLQNIVSAIYWPHPLVRKLNRELAKAREEVCDNFVLVATAAPTYSRRLLSIAQLMQQSVTLPGSVGFFADRWKLEHRIAGLLDQRRNRSTCLDNRGWLYVGATTALLATFTCLATITTATASFNEAISTETLSTAKEIMVRGVVLKPDGRPADGATVRAAAPVFADMRGVLGTDFETPIKEVVADKQGRFEISIDSEPYGKLPTKGTQWKDFWKKTVISATMPGFAGQFTKYADVEDVNSVSLKLVEDAPIRGRVVGLEGKPISGVTIEVKDVLVSPNESLDGWLQAVRNGEPAWTAVKHISRQIEPRLLGVPETVTTDSDGAFSIERLGRERCIRLNVHGNGIAFEDFQVVTRSMNPLTWNDVGLTDSPSSVYGVEFTLVGRPSRPVNGTVTDAKTGMPLAGVEVGAETISGYRVSGRWLLPTKSDSRGQFRIESMPKGKGNRIMFRPSDDQPYFMREIDVPDSDGMAPVAIDVGLHRGIWIEGKVIDKQSREPVAGVRVHYLPFLTNKLASELPEFDLGTVQGQQNRYQTDISGKYRLVGLPGPAVVGIQSIHKPYRLGVGYDALTVPKDEHGAQTYRNPLAPRPRWPTAMAQIDPSMETDKVQLDFELDPGQTIQVSVFDESNEWLTGGDLINGLALVSQRVKIERVPVDVTNLAPNESREIVVHHEKRGLGVVHHLTASDIAAGNLRLIARPCARLSGRLVRDGEPLSGVSVTPAILPSGDFTQSLATVTTDENGYFETVLLPGCKYRLRMEGPQFRFASIEEEIEVSPGVNIELGTLALSDGRKFKRTEKTN